MKIHELKTLPEYYKAVANGHKTFEYRVNDRDFKVGDFLVLKEFENRNTAYEHYSGAETMRRITYILQNEFGLPEGWCILGISNSLKD